MPNAHTHAIEKLQQLVDAAPVFRLRPRIVANNRDLQDRCADTIAALVESNTPPHLFIRGGKLTRVLIDERSRATTETMNPQSLPLKLNYAAQYVEVKVGKKGASEAIVDPDTALVNAVLTAGTWPQLPELRTLTTAPVVSPQGHLESVPGYLPESKLFYHSADPVNTKPIVIDQDHITAARELLMTEFLGDFPFVDDASRANTVAMLLLPFARPLIDGPTPPAPRRRHHAGHRQGPAGRIVCLPLQPARRGHDGRPQER